MSSLESRVLPAARQFNQLGVVGETVDEIPHFSAIENGAKDLSAKEFTETAGHPASGIHGDLHLVSGDEGPQELEPPD